AELLHLVALRVPGADLLRAEEVPARVDLGEVDEVLPHFGPTGPISDSLRFFRFASSGMSGRSVGVGSTGEGRPPPDGLRSSPASAPEARARTSSFAFGSFATRSRTRRTPSLAPMSARAMITTDLIRRFV